VNHRIQKFDNSGNFLTAWGSRGYRDGEFEWPTSIVVDNSGNVYVVDNGNHRIQKFAPAAATPVAFTANITTGVAPLAVQFTDTSTDNPTAWSWSFGDENTSSEQHPTHTYAIPGTYTVNLTITTATSSFTLSRPDYITVTAPKGDFNNNGVVDIGDVSKVAYMVVGKAAADPAADFNENGAVDIGDAAKIAYYYVGKIPAL